MAPLFYECNYIIYRWLKLKGRNKEALAILSRVNKYTNIQKKALEAEEDETKEDETKSGNVNKLYLIKELFKYKYRWDSTNHAGPCSINILLDCMHFEILWVFLVAPLGV